MTLASQKFSNPSLRHLPKQALQQRRILTMMGVQTWVGHNTMTVPMTMSAAELMATESMLDEAVTSEQISEQVNEHLNAGHADDARHDSNGHADAPVTSDALDAINGSLNEQAVPSQGTGLAPIDSQAANPYNPDTVQDDATDDTSRDHELRDVGQSISHAQGFETGSSLSEFEDEPEVAQGVPARLAPFVLQGVRYQNWVLLVDINELQSQHDGQLYTLWQNLCAALSQPVETLNFPVCQGMDDVEIANACLAGFMFKVGGNDRKKVAALTALAEGLDHERLTRVPMLEEMLIEPRLKRQLWQLLQE